MTQVSQFHDMSASHSVVAPTIPCLRPCLSAVADSAVSLLYRRTFCGQSALALLLMHHLLTGKSQTECLLQNLALAVTGFKAMLKEHSAQPGAADSVLVIAGGYDRRLAENREHFEELVGLVAERQLQGKVCGAWAPVFQGLPVSFVLWLAWNLPRKRHCVYCTAMRIAVRVAVL